MNEEQRPRQNIEDRGAPPRLRRRSRARSPSGLATAKTESSTRRVRAVFCQLLQRGAACEQRTEDAHRAFTINLKTLFGFRSMVYD
jgi:hypothetical protein